MHLTRDELECLAVHSAGHVAQRRLSRGLKLNLPEATALLTSQGLEFIRDGQEDINKLEADIRRLLGFRQVLSGVPELIQDLVFEAPFSDGQRLVHISDPICAPDGDLELALSGSCLPAPAYEVFGGIVDDRSVVPGAITVKDHHQSPIELNGDAVFTSFMYFTNTGDSEISIGSHFHLTEANRALQFDRSLALGMRLNIPAGEVVSFQPGEVKEVAIVKIGGQNIIRGGNFICDGPLDENSQRKTIKNVKKRGFLHRSDECNGSSMNEDRCCAAHISREQYIQVYGPTTGDKIQLADTCLIIEIERDLTTYGDECVVGTGKVVREGMGQMANVRNDVAVDLVISGAIVIDPIMGIFKSDVGIRDGLIQGMGKAGNPNTMSSVTMIIGVGTDIIPGQNLIVTPGTFVPGLTVSNPEQLMDMIMRNGMTSAFLCGASGSVTGSTAGPNAVKQALQALDDIPINTGILAKANTSKSEGVAKEVEDVLVSGAGGLILNEMWGCTSAALDTALRLADYHDVSLLASLDRMRECYSPGDLLTLSKQRLLIVPYGKDLTSEILKHPSVILTSYPRFVRSDVPTDTLERLSEEVLQDVGAISFVSNSVGTCNQTCQSDYVRSIWQIAHRMKALSWI